MFAKSKNGAFASSSNSSLDWECDEGSQSWASTASWSDGVEAEATSRLHKQLQDIDSVLYGEASPKTLPPALRLEVAQWRATFPHLRVCGTRPPMGPRPSEPEEGQEEVYAIHGDFEEFSEVGSDQDKDSESEAQSLDSSLETQAALQSDSSSKCSDKGDMLEQVALRNQLEKDVLKKLFEKLCVDVSQSYQKVSKEPNVPPVSGSRIREPLLVIRHSARKEIPRRYQQPSHDAELGSLLRVSPLPRRQCAGPPARAATVKSRRSVVLPPIDVQPDSSRSPQMPLSVLGRQTRLIQQRAKVLR